MACKKCKCNQFTIIKSRSTNSYRNRGYRTFICLNCISIETEWETIQEVKTIHIPEYIDKIEELENLLRGHGRIIKEDKYDKFSHNTRSMYRIKET